MMEMATTVLLTLLIFICGASLFLVAKIYSNFIAMIKDFQSVLIEIKKNSEMLNTGIKQINSNSKEILSTEREILTTLNQVVNVEDE